MTNTLKGKWGFDSNIIIYSFNQEAKQYKKTLNLFQFLLDEQAELYITSQNVLEAENILVNEYNLDKKRVINDIEKFVESFMFTLIPPKKNSIYRFHRLFEKSRSKDIFDIFMAATYLDWNITRFLTNNERHFKKIPELKAINPYKEFKLD